MNGCVVKGKMLRVTPRSHYARVLAFKILPEFVLETQEGRFIFSVAVSLMFASL